jgi:hypothetical protein
MFIHTSTRYAALAMLVGALACARNQPDSETEPDQAAAARDTTSDTTGGQVQNPPGYRGMERDTTIAPAQREPSDTFLENQGVGTPQDTAGYAGMERLDTTGLGARDTTGAVGADTTQMDHGIDSAGVHRDTTGYNPSQQPSQDTVQDTTSGRY